MSWTIRFEGSQSTAVVPTAQRVMEGIREGEWEPTDDVRGPGDREWTPIEEHRQFVEAIAELEPEARHEEDETHLDMNPLIDVALVLLIFFILTTTYSVLRRSVDVPGEPEGEKGKTTKQIKAEDIQDRAFKVEAWMIDERARLRVNDKIVEVEELEKALSEMIRATGKRDIILEFEGIPWGILAQIMDAAKGAEVQNINFKRKKKK
jgi:biopolymer transport protein ExbD